jgi:hypothetical protein
VFDVVRRVLLAIGSFFAAALSVSLVGGVCLSIPDPGHPVFGATANPTVATLATLVTIVLGGLIYRDIIRRETRSS